MNILALDTSSDTLHLALDTGSSYLGTTRTIGRKFSEELVLRMKAICEEAGISLSELSLIVCANGPGSFTGLRVGMAAAKGISLAGGIPLVSLSTMDILHYPLRHVSLPVLCVLDAKKQRYYSALFHRGKRITADTDATLGMLCDLTADHDEIVVTGPDAEEAARRLGDEVTLRGMTKKIHVDDLFHRDHGQSMIILGKNLYEREGADDIGSGPTYIRKSDAELSLEERDAHIIT